ncbi:hypothetical protein K439DRAFT_1612526 [Ramaria rubella]|nr:hypothetical protein K439DRAFT_1612526 [Ramaria rubella]
MVMSTLSPHSCSPCFSHLILDRPLSKMPKNNPLGKNGIDNGTWPSNDVLKASLLQYAKEDLRLKDRLRRLGDKHGLYINVRKGPKGEHAAQLVLNHVVADTHRLNSAGYIKMALAMQGHMIPHANVHQVILNNDPEGVDARYPGPKKIKCTQLTSIRVFDGVCCDGHDKANTQTLLSHIKPTMYQIAAIPLRITVDKGTETGEIFAMQTSLRRNYAPNVCEESYPPFMALWSIHNTTIEGIWHWLRKTVECNFITKFGHGHTEGIFNPNHSLHVSLFNWIWPPICQSVLDEFTRYWNNHQAYGGEHCSIPVSQDAIDALQAQLLQARTEALKFVDEEFAAIASKVWNHLRSPPCMVFSGWDIFAKMLSVWPHTNEET